MKNSKIKYLIIGISFLLLSSSMFAVSQDSQRLIVQNKTEDYAISITIFVADDNGLVKQEAPKELTYIPPDGKNYVYSLKSGLMSWGWVHGREFRAIVSLFDRKHNKYDQEIVIPVQGSEIVTGQSWRRSFLNGKVILSIFVPGAPHTSAKGYPFNDWGFIFHQVP